jgi:LmbE family N-acetylglucosaminyl deacetylase
MKFGKATASVFVPDGKPVEEALRRVTHLGVGAHQDDLEFMAFHGILECFHAEDRWFGGVTCTNGAGSSRTGGYADYTDVQMMAVRRDEQEKAAVVGRYGVMVQLDYPSSAVKSASDSQLRDDLLRILELARPQFIYTHNPADKHDTHLGVMVALLEAVRLLPEADRPEAVWGCEGWRNLDWMDDSEKVVQDVSGHDNLAAALNGIFDSQIAGGKRYDLAVAGRRRANATFFASHASDESDAAAYAMDLTPLVSDPSLDILDFTLGHLQRFADDVRARLGKRLGRA